MYTHRRRLHHCECFKARRGWAISVLAWLLLTTSSLAQAEAVSYPSAELREAPMRLRTEPVPDDPEQLSCRFTAQRLALLEKLNRADVDHLARLKGIVVPDRWDLRELDYSPLPQRAAWAARLPKALVVHQPVQAFGAYEDGTLVRWGPLSSGAARRPTPAGLFHLNWKSKGRHSTVNRDWFLRWYFNFVNEDGISFHEYALPGYPASHGCIRLLGRDARWLYEWGEEWQLGPKGWSIATDGTPVWILGDYDYQQAAPWHTREYVLAGGQVFFEGVNVATVGADKLSDEDQSAPQVAAADSGDAKADSI